MSDRSAADSPRIVVVGSINMDLVVHSQRLPLPGETVMGLRSDYISGGKGANQAVAAARLGGRVSMIGRVGDDQLGERLRDGLRNENVDVTLVARTERCTSGLAIVAVADDGENAITVIPGANARLTSQDVRAATKTIQEADVLLVQMEVPVDTVVTAVRLARENQVTTILDPAPAPTVVPAGLLDVDYVCPNESEAEILTGLEVTSDQDAAESALRLRELGAKHAVITLGGRGAMYCDVNGQCRLIPHFPIVAVDTTAAGDAFAAGLAVALAEGMTCDEAIRHACAAGAFAASRPGAQPAMPRRNDLAPLFASVRQPS